MVKNRTAGTTQAALDLSLVINIHRGQPFLARTMRSFEEAAAVARSAGLRVEAVFVLDRSDPPTVEWVQSYDPCAFEAFQIAEVDFGSLGLSRDHGLRLAHGTYIMFGDEDDLISSNTMTESYRLAEAEGPRCIVIPEYQFGFGMKNFIARYFGTEQVSPHSFIAYHPFVSRLFVHRSIKNYAEFIDVPSSSGYAYEDWHFNATAYSLGYIYRPAPETILFYRHRQGLLESMNATSTRQIPPTRLFHPQIYQHTCANCEFLLDRFPPSGSEPEGIRAAFFGSSVLRELVSAAHIIEPAIDIENLRGTPALSNTTGNLLLGAGYLRACEIVDDSLFSDVVLWTSTAHDSGMQNLMMFLETLRESEPTFNVLVLNSNAARDTAALTKSIPEATSVNLATLKRGLEDADIDTIALRLIESSAPTARLHLLSGEFAHRFFTRFHILLNKHRNLYYPLGCLDETMANPNPRTAEAAKFMSAYAAEIEEIPSTAK